LLFRAASAAAWIAVTGTASTMSMPARSFTSARSSLTYLTVSATVLCILKFPAMYGVRTKFDPGIDRFTDLRIDE
jgi:hypothetical protein